MSRKRVIAKRDMRPDPRYNSLLAAKFVNNLMKKGKKSVARSILYGAFDIVEGKSKEEPLSVFKKAVENVKPRVEVKSRRVGGSTYQVPTEVRSSRSQALSIRWIISFAKARAKRPWQQNSQGNCLMPPTRGGPPSRRGKIRTEWLKPIRPLLTTAGKNDEEGRKVQKVTLALGF